MNEYPKRKNINYRRINKQKDDKLIIIILKFQISEIM